MIYLKILSRILKSKNNSNLRLILYRLDKHNIFLDDERNISGTLIGQHQSTIDAMSLSFYRHLEKSVLHKNLSIKKTNLYSLHTRQVKLKLTGILRCAIRIKNLEHENQKKIEIITDLQTAKIMKEAFLFLKYEPVKIEWKINVFLTLCISLNSLVMRFIAVTKMIVMPSSLPLNYYYKHVSSEAPTVLITMPKRKPEDFFRTYVEEFCDKFNILLYSLGSLKKTPRDYKCLKIKRSIGFLAGIFNFRSLCFNSSSYIDDILLIYKDHANLSASIDVGRQIYSHKIDAHISRLQTSVVDNYLATEAKRRGIFVLGDVFEEIYYCDSAICSSASENSELLKLALNDSTEVIYKGSNSLINYRLKSFEDGKSNYLHNLLQIGKNKKVIFYASDPSKEESQRYLTEVFLMEFFSKNKDYNFVMKTHPQDSGRVTYNAFLNSAAPSNVYLIGDIAQKNSIASRTFLLFDDFDFNSAIHSSDGFLTFSSSSILQALCLDIKTGIVDRFKNGFYDYLVKHKASLLIDNEISLLNFLKTEKLDLSSEILSYCGLEKGTQEFNVGEHLIDCLKKNDGTNINTQMSR